MKYSIKKVAEMAHLPISTLRYYDREGLLPSLERGESGYRVFSDDDLAWLQVIDCFKKTGLQIKEIKHFMDLYVQGDSSLEARYQLFLERKKAVKAQISEMQEMLKLIDLKCCYYQKAIEAGTEAVHRGETCLGVERDGSNPDIGMNGSLPS